MRCGRPLFYTWRIFADSVGPILLDRTIEDVRRSCPGAADSTIAMGIPELVIPGFGGKLLLEPESAAYVRPRGPIGSAIVRTPEVRRPDGIGVGSTLQDLRAHFGSMLIWVDPEAGFYAVERRPSPFVYWLEATALATTRFTEEDSAVASDGVPGEARVEAVMVWSPTVMRLDQQN